MVYEGLFMRHYLGQTPESPDTGAKSGWTASPDIIPWGRAAEPEPKIEELISEQGYMNPFKSDIYEKQANRVYVRGMNTKANELNVRVWLYYVYSDVLLWPQNWRGDNIQVGNSKQNYVMVSARQAKEIVAGNPPFIWTPPALPPNNPHYCLVAIVEDPPSEPPVAPLPGYMGSWDGLAKYVVTHPNIAWRNVYYIPSQIPQWQTINPIIGPPDGGEINIGIKWEKMPVGSAYEIYAKGPGKGNDNDVQVPKTPITVDHANYTIPVTWPKNFETTVIITYYKDQAKTDPGEGAYISAISQIEETRLLEFDPGLEGRLLMQGEESFVYDSPEMKSGEIQRVHTVGSMIHMFHSLRDDDPTWKETCTISAVPNGQEFYIGFSCIDMPTDGKLRLNVPGPDKANSIDTGKIRLEHSHMTITYPVTWPPNFSSIATIEWWKGSTTPLAGARIDIVEAQIEGKEYCILRGAV